MTTQSSSPGFPSLCVAELRRAHSLVTQVELPHIEANRRKLARQNMHAKNIFGSHFSQNRIYDTAYQVLAIRLMLG